MALLTRVTDKSARASRALWITAIAFSVFGIVFVRLAYLQLFKGKDLEVASENNKTRIVVEHAPRGRILDRNGKILADNKPVFVAFFSPIGLSASELQLAMERLSPIVDLPKLELEHRLRAALRGKSMMRVSDVLTREQAFLILQNRNQLPGVSLTIEEQRYYPGGQLASHVLGYVGQVTDQDMESFPEEGYRPGGWIGKTGLERLFDPLLQGQDGGFLIEVDARGRQVKVRRYVAPKAGKDLYLTLDKDLEMLAEKRLKDTGHPGAAVVLNPQTGEVLALASNPGYDPNTFLPTGKSEERTRLLNDPKLPLYNRAIQALYPPGSTFKIITSIAQLEEHVLDTHFKIQCTGSYTLGAEKRRFGCWKKEGHGWMDFHRALAESCDVYFYQVGLKLGPKRIEHIAKAMGLGQRSGIDLPSERKGSLPLASRTAAKQYWVAGETLNYAIGQGALQVSPLQMANVAAMTSTRGVLFQPFIASEWKLFNKQGEILATPHQTMRLDASATTWRLVNSSLEEVVKSGTGVASQIKETTVAGKTGTAQATKGDDHAWFIAYAPSEKPQVACAVVVEHGGHGGAVAAPIVRDLISMAMGFHSSGGSAPVPVKAVD